MNKQIIFVTGNSYKFEVAQKSLEGSSVELIQQKLDTPEIQSTSVEEVASYSAKWASEKLGQPVAVTDAGYFIEALSGFPGPYIKYINQWLTADDIVNLMEGKPNRKVIAKDCLAYCEPGKEPVTFTKESFGTISEKPEKIDDSSPIDEVFIPEGFDKPQTLIPKRDMINFWAKGDDNWKKLANYLINS